MGDLVVWGLSASALIVLLIQAAKKLGLPTGAAPWVAGALAALVAAVIGAYQLWPEAGRYLDILGVAVMLWLTSIGTYEKGKDVAERML